MSEQMIQMNDVVKDYGTTRALNRVGFEVSRGQVVGFLGPNGAGKSTAMRILTGYLKPTSGSVRVAGIDVEANSVEAQKHIGYLPESNPLYDEMMVYEYLEYAAEMRGLPVATRPDRIRDTLDRCGLGEVRGRDIGALSKGFRQRVGLAHAILHDPDLLVLDEPTTGLDPNQVLEIRELIRELGREKTVLMSTHILPEVQATCSRVLILSDGEVAADDTPEHLARSGGGTVEIELVAKSGALAPLQAVSDQLRALEGVSGVAERDSAPEGGMAFVLELDDADPRRALFECAVAQGWILLRIDHQRLSLEEIFRRLTTNEEL